jgi:hypothetical protein
MQMLQAGTRIGQRIEQRETASQMALLHLQEDLVSLRILLDKRKEER